MRSVKRSEELAAVKLVRSTHGMGFVPRFVVNVVCEYREIVGLVGPDVLVCESEGMAHLMADLRPAETGDGNQLRTVAAGHEVKEAGGSRLCTECGSAAPTELIVRISPQPQPIPSAGFTEPVTPVGTLHALAAPKRSGGGSRITHHDFPHWRERSSQARKERWRFCCWRRAEGRNCRCKR